MVPYGAWVPLECLDRNCSSNPSPAGNSLLCFVSKTRVAELRLEAETETDHTLFEHWLPVSVLSYLIFDGFS